MNIAVILICSISLLLSIRDLIVCNRKDREFKNEMKEREIWFSKSLNERYGTK